MGMSNQSGDNAAARPFQFRLRTLMVLVVGICGLLTFLRLLGSDAPFAFLLMVAAVLGAACGQKFRRPLRGAIDGATLILIYGLSIRVIEHIGHRAGWPAGMLLLWERYSQLWFAVVSTRVWKAFMWWECFYEDIQRMYGSESPPGISSLAIGLLIAAMIVWGGRRLHVALLLPYAIGVAGLAVVACKDVDAAFCGWACGLLFAIPVAGCNQGHYLVDAQFTRAPA